MPTPASATPSASPTPTRPTTPVVYASDGFVDATGYSRADVIPRNCRFLQGPLTDGATVLRMKEAVARRVEAVELVVNYRKDGQPFWNLVYICPLKATNGKVRFYLGGQINVSEAIRSHKDMLHVLNFGSSATLETGPTGSSAGAVPDKPAFKARKLERDASIRGRDRQPVPPPPKSDKPPSASKAFFKPFRRSHDTSPSPSYRSLISSSATELLQEQPSLAAQMDEFDAAYSRFIVLQFVPASSSYTPQGAVAAPRLKVTFTSRGALEAIGLGPGAQEAVLYHDVFSVLSELAGSPSITALFKAAVRERVSVGDAVSLELLVPAAGGVIDGGGVPVLPRQSGANTKRSSIISLGGRGGAGDDGWGIAIGSRGRRSSGTSSRAAAAATTRMHKLMTHWTPLKDGDGTVCWVMMVVSPTFGAGSVVHGS